jgi:hypothetical protein
MEKHLEMMALIIVFFISFILMILEPIVAVFLK